VTDVVLRWLAGVSQERLAMLLDSRPSLLGAGPDGAVASLSELAERLGDPLGAGEALLSSPTPLLEVAEAVAALGPGPVPVVRLAALLGRGEDDRELSDVLHQLDQIGVVLRDGDELIAPAPLREVFREPLRLGPPATALFERLTMVELAGIARTTGMEAERSRGDLIAGLVAFVADSDLVRRVVAGAPAKTRLLLEAMAAHGSRRPFGSLLGTYQGNPADVDWAQQRGLLGFARDWSYSAEMPAEVGLALRGPAYRAPFHPEPPRVPTAAVPPGLPEREAAAAVTAAVERIGAVVDECDRQSVSLLKSGGVGVRELKRLSKRLSLEEAQVRLWMEIAGEIGLLSTDGTQVGVTSRYDDFRKLTPAERADLIVHAWLGMAILPTWQPPDGKQEPPLAFFAADAALQTLRMTLFAVAQQVLPENEGVTSMTDFVAAVRWFAPVLSGNLADGVVEAIWAEAHVLGLVVHGGPTSLGRAVTRMESDCCSIKAAAATLAAPASETGIFQTDLTVIVPGAASAALADLLDSSADREGRCWRFSASSVRRALDAGTPAADLEAALTRASQSQSLPQPLRYLISDVARRHGAVRVRPAGCVIRADDERLLAELAASAQLKPLGLWQPVPQLLISVAAVEKTLALLRSAGYAPVEEGANGEIVVERRQVRRTAAPEVEQYLDSTLEDGLAWLGDPFDVVQLADPLDLAARLLDGPEGPAASGPATDPTADRPAANGPANGPTAKGKKTGPAATGKSQRDQDEIDYLERLFHMD
jgi:Helicase conserved C-terminal domain